MSQNRLEDDTFIPQVFVRGGGTDPLVDLYVVKAPNGQPATFTLNPAYRPGDRVRIQDGLGNANTQPITILASSDRPIAGSGTSLAIGTANGGFELTLVADGPNEYWMASSISPTIATSVPTPLLITRATTVIIDPINGNDATPNGPFQTAARFNQWVKGATIANTLTVQVLSTLLPTDEPIAPECRTISGSFFSGSIQVDGTPGVTALATGTLTAGTVNIDPATNTRSTVEATDLAGGFGPFQNNFLSTTGTTPTIGAWLMNPKGALCDTTQAADTSNNTTDFASGEAFAVQSMPGITFSGTGIINENTDGTFALGFLNLSIGGQPFFDGNIGVFASQCVFTSPLAYSSERFISECDNCLLTLGYKGANPTSLIVLDTGGTNTLPQTQGSVQMEDNHYVTGGGIVVGTNAASPISNAHIGNSLFTFSGVQFQDCTNIAALQCEYGGFVQCLGTNARLWGNGNGLGLGVGVGATVLVSTNGHSLVTGTTGDFGFFTSGGAVDQHGYPWTPSTYGAAIASTWSNLYNAGQLNNGAHYPATNAHVVAQSGSR